MPALTIPSPTNTPPAATLPDHLSQRTDKSDVSQSHSFSQSQSQSQSQPQSQSQSQSPLRSQSPDRPPISPLTPTTSASQLHIPDPPVSPAHTLPPPLTATFREQPPSLPISESENPDAIALRSAISLLQLQREKSKRDLKALEDLKSAAVSDPTAFVKSLHEQRSRPSPFGTDPLGPTLADTAGLVSEERTGNGQPQKNGGNHKSHANVEADSDGEEGQATQFPAIPTPQNVIRCPPVNWAKYHVVAEPLDKMHEEQKRWPGSAEPPRTGTGRRAPPHAVAAPYSPYTDGVNNGSRTQASREFKKSPS